MRLDKECESILDKAQEGQSISPREADTLMRIDLQSPEMYALCSVANTLSRKHFSNTGDVCAQIGLDYAPCKGNCGFCVFAAKHKIINKASELSKGNILQAALDCNKEKPNALLLMTTCHYDFNKFLDIGLAVSKVISPDIPLVANIPDFTRDEASALVDAGFHAIYHAVRLNEGKDTAFQIEKRILTMEAALDAGLAVHSCVEPLGPEHSIETQLESMFLQKKIGVSFSGAAHRVSVPGTALAPFGDVSHWYLARTVAVSRLVMGDRVQAHCTHEPNLPSILAGANLIWAEVGTNPRDKNKETEHGRGMSISQCQKMLQHAGYNPRIGPTPSAMGNAWHKTHKRVLEPG